MNTDTEVLKGLLAKVEAATGADQLLDFWLGVHLPSEPIKATVEEIQSDIDLLGIDGMYIEAPYTASIDAARALVERALPGWSCESGRSGFGNPAWCRLWNPMRSPGSDNTVRFDDNAGSEPRAILGSLLTALIAHGGRHEG